MRIYNEHLQISASDLAKHLACRHLTMLELQEARGEIRRLYFRDPGVIVLEQRGLRHETEYLSHLKGRGIDVFESEGPDVEHALERTLGAMKSGIPVIVQAYLELGLSLQPSPDPSLNKGGECNWRGRADILFRVATPSKLGNWSYEVHDSKLARETKGGTILQLCLYSELVEKIQGCMPEAHACRHSRTRLPTGNISTP